MEAIPGKALDLPLVTHIGIVASLTAQRTQTWHQHHGFELLFVLSGATAWEFKDRPPIEVTGGHYLIVPPGSVHRVERAVRKPSELCGLVCDPGPRTSLTNSPFTRRDVRVIDERLRATAWRVLPLGQGLTAHVARLLTLKRAFEHDPRTPLLSAGLRTHVCAIILEAACGPMPASTPTSSTGPAALMAAAHAYLLDHLGEPVRIPDLVRHMGFSRSHLFALFKTATGMTPNDYFLRLRLGVAQQQLARSADTITAIALRTGFSSSQYFSNVFRKYTGQTPLAYRQSNVRVK